MDNFVEFAKYGLAGVCVLLIGVIVYIFKLWYKTVANHIHHNTEAFHDMKDVMLSLREIIKERLK